MKHILTLIGCLWMLLLTLQAQPKITFKQDKQELGYVLWRRPVTVNYEFTNTGNQPLVISNVTTSCGCTSATWTQGPVPAGGK